MARPVHQSSTPSRIARRIRRARNDAVFTTGDFLDLDSRSAVDAMRPMFLAEPLSFDEMMSVLDEAEKSLNA